MMQVWIELLAGTFGLMLALFLMIIAALWITRTPQEANNRFYNSDDDFKSIGRWSGILGLGFMVGLPVWVACTFWDLYFKAGM